MTSSDFPCTELATEDDRAYKIDYWAAIFKAETWEEIRMLAKENEYLQEAANSLYVANADEIVRQQCIAREDAERRERTLERLVMQKQAKLEEQEKLIEEQAREIEKMKALLAEKGL